MKKLFFYAATALLIGACSKDEVSDINHSHIDGNAVKLSLSTLKAASTNLSGLQDDLHGFNVWASNDNSEYIPAWTENIGATNGPNVYAYNQTNKVWEWHSITGGGAADGSNTLHPSPKWPDASTGNYPMVFYALYPRYDARNDVITSLTADPSGTNKFNAEITVPTDKNDQVDLLTATTKISAKPADGLVSLSFQHMLTRLSVNVNPGIEQDIRVQSVKFMNLKDENSLDFHFGDATQVTWNTSTDNADQNFEFYNNAPGAKTFDQNKTGNPRENFPFYDTQDGLDNQYLMLMPQTITAWDHTNTQSLAGDTAAQNASLKTGAYIEVTYRIHYADSTQKLSYIGLPKARWHTAWINATGGYLADKNGDPTSVQIQTDGATGKKYFISANGDTIYEDDAVFGRVGFPI